MPFLRATVPLLLVLCDPLAAQGRTVRRATPFELVCHFQDDLFADDAAAVLAQVWKFAEKRLQPTAKMASARFQVHVYDTREAYVAVVRKLQMGGYEKFQGFADPRTKSAHVLRDPAAFWTRTDLDPINRHLLAHEAAHLMVSLCCANRGNFLPKWVAEGFAMWAEGEVMRLGGFCEDRVADLGEGTRVQAAQQQIEAGTFPKVEDLLADRTALDDMQIYHPIRMLWVFLGERHPTVLDGVVEDLRTLAASAALPQIFAGNLRSRLPAAALERVDEDLRAFVAQRKVPQFPQVPGLAADAKGQPGDVDFRPGSPAVGWLGSSNKSSYTITGKLTLRLRALPQADLLYGRLGDRWLRVSLVAGGGVFLLARTSVDAASGRWEVLASNRDVPALATEEPLRVRLVARGTKTTLQLDGTTVLEHDHAPHAVPGRWGVGGPQGSAARWEDVRLR